MKALSLSFLLLFLLPFVTSTRPLRYSSSKLISDGIDEEEDSMIRLKGLDHTGECTQMYGFMPCSESVTGHLFLIAMYEFLLFYAESYVADGGERIFKMLGTGFFGASAFQIIGSLPEALILLASGLVNSKDIAQECVYTGVGLLAGSTILLLTLVWGTCVILGSQEYSIFQEPNRSQDTQLNRIETFFLSNWPGYGVETDAETNFTAMIMLVSVIPLILMGFPIFIHSSSSSGERILILITLIVSASFLLAYFFYQFIHRGIQERRLEYIRELLAVDMLNLVHKHTMGALFTAAGDLNIPVLKRLFHEADKNGDKNVSITELKQFLKQINLKKLQSGKLRVIEDIIMKDFDVDGNKNLNEDEFVNGMSKWLGKAKDASGKKQRHFKEIAQPLVDKTRERRESVKRLIPDILKGLQTYQPEKLFTDEGNPNETAIRELFKEIDTNKDNSISPSELENLVMKINFSNLSADDIEAVASGVMQEFDKNGDSAINEDEFVKGLCKWLEPTSDPTANSEHNHSNDNPQETSEQNNVGEQELVDKSQLAWMKAITLVVIGVAILGVLAEPLIHSVHDFSKAARASPFLIAFIFVPLASNARIAISAISEVRRKKLKIVSLTFSEIYSTVFMNNILGLVVLLFLIYFRGLSWNFSAEVLMVLAVSAIMGILSSVSKVIPVWTSLVAYLLYPLSLVLLYLLGHSFGE